MKQLFKTIFITLVFIFSMTGISKAVDFSVLLGTWDGAIHFAKIGALDSFDWRTTMTFTEITPNGATGYDEFGPLAVSWMPDQNQFKIINPTDPNKYPYRVTVTGNYMYGDYGHDDILDNPEPFNATKRIETCPTYQPTFDLESSVLTLPTVCIDGKTYQNIQIRLKMDGTWDIP